MFTGPEGCRSAMLRTLIGQRGTVVRCPSSRDSVEGIQVLFVGVGQRVKVLLGRLDLVVTHPVHY